MKTLIALLALTLVTACASKKTAETTPAKTETPATMAATQTPAVETKKEDKKSNKKAKAQAAAKSEMGTTEVNCKSGADERKLAIQVKEAGCELQYTKAGESKVIASQINGSEKCEEVITVVKEKLVAANFTCQ